VNVNEKLSGGPDHRAVRHEPGSLGPWTTSGSGEVRQNLTCT
jgi:hypothetical protein